MLVNNGQFIQLTNNSAYDTLKGQPLYVDSKRICVIRQRFNVNGYKNGSYIYLDGFMNDDGEAYLMVKESPEDIIGLINDGCFCAFSNKFPYDQIPYPEK